MITLCSVGWLLVALFSTTVRYLYKENRRLESDNAALARRLSILVVQKTDRTAGK